VPLPASAEDDATELSSFPLKPGTAGAECAGLQLGQFVAALGLAQANRELVANELATAAGEDGRTAGETCPLLSRISSMLINPDRTAQR
jgi:hypothetical protein